MTKKIILLMLVIFIPVLGLLGAGIFYFQYVSNDSPQLSSECTSVELYDEATGECYYECDTDAECLAIEERIDAELNQLFETTTTKAGPHSSTSDGQEEQSEQEDTGQESESDSNSQSYQYINGTFSPAIKDAEQSKYANIFVGIATKEFANTFLSQVTFFNDVNNDTAASVSQNQDNMTKWDLEVNMAYATDENEMLMTLVHEYAHIYSLNNTQVDGEIAGSCPALQIAEGCSRQDSFLNSFQTKFWTGINADPENAELGAYYAGNEGNFVSEYAATNVVEDFADTFAYATLKNPAGFSGVAAEKVTWMKSDPQIAQRMKEIKTTLASDLRARRIIN